MSFLGFALSMQWTCSGGSFGPRLLEVKYGERDFFDVSYGDQWIILEAELRFKQNGLVKLTKWTKCLGCPRPKPPNLLDNLSFVASGKGMNQRLKLEASKITLKLNRPISLSLFQDLKRTLSWMPGTLTSCLATSRSGRVSLTSGRLHRPLLKPRLKQRLF